MSHYVMLTRSTNDTPVLVNFDQVIFVEPVEKRGTRIHFVDKEKPTLYVSEDFERLSRVLTTKSSR